MTLSTTMDMKDFIQNDQFELHSYLTYLFIQVSEKKDSK